jgi:hypothetical protein
MEGIHPPPGGLAVQLHTEDWAPLSGGLQTRLSPCNHCDLVETTQETRRRSHITSVMHSAITTILLIPNFDRPQWQ